MYESHPIKGILLNFAFIFYPFYTSFADVFFDLSIILFYCMTMFICEALQVCLVYEKCYKIKVALPSYGMSDLRITSTLLDH